MAMAEGKRTVKRIDEAMLFKPHGCNIEVERPASAANRKNVCPSL